MTPIVVACRLAKSREGGKRQRRWWGWTDASSVFNAASCVGIELRASPYNVLDEVRPRMR